MGHEDATPAEHDGEGLISQPSFSLLGRARHQVTAASLLTSPPEGVRLESLASADSQSRPKQVQEDYDRAFALDGGEAQLEPFAAMSAELARKVAEQKIPARQPAVWQAYTVDQMLDAATGGPLRSFGEQQLRQMERDLRSELGNSLRLEIAAPKREQRAWVKAKIKYGLDCSRLCDLNRATLLCPDIKVMYEALQRICRCWGPEANMASVKVLELDDHFQQPFPEHYRHLQLLILMSGAVWELQLNTKEMLAAKASSGHEFYKTTRFVREMLLLCSMSDEHDTCLDMLRMPGVSAVADPDAVADKNGLRALHHAAFRGNVVLVRTLLDEGEAHVATPADPWRLDEADLGGLALNYALRMRHWGAVRVLCEAMRRKPPVHPLAMNAQRRLIEAAEVAVDCWAEEGDLLLLLAALCRSHASDIWPVDSPVAYAFRQRLEEPLRRLLPISPGAAAGAAEQLPHSGASWASDESEHSALLWTPDASGALPLEQATHLGMKELAADLAAAMLHRKPPHVPVGAAWSLLRCRREDAADTETAALAELLRSNEQRMHRRLWTSSEDTPRRVEVWNALTLDRMATHEIDTYVYVMVVAGDILYAGAGNGDILRFDLHHPTGALKRPLKGHNQLVRALCPSGRRYLLSASYDKSVRKWDVVTGDCKREIKLGGMHRLRCVAACGKNIYSGGTDIRVMDGDTGSIVTTLRGHTDIVTVIRFAARDTQAITAGKDSSIRFWDTTSYACLKVIATAHSGGVRDLFVAPAAAAGAADPAQVCGEELYSVGHDKTVRVWDSNFSPAREWPICAVGSSCYHIDDVLYVSDLDGHVRVFAAATGALLLDVAAHKSGIYGCTVAAHCQGQPSAPVPRGSCSDRSSIAGGSSRGTE